MARAGTTRLMGLGRWTAGLATGLLWAGAALAQPMGGAPGAPPRARARSA